MGDENQTAVNAAVAEMKLHMGMMSDRAAQLAAQLALAHGEIARLTEALAAKNDEGVK